MVVSERKNAFAACEQKNIWCAGMSPVIIFHFFFLFTLNKCRRLLLKSRVKGSLYLLCNVPSIILNSFIVENENLTLVATYRADGLLLLHANRFCLKRSGRSFT